MSVEAQNKVYVKNLSFSTKESELAEHLAKAGEIESVNIITRRLQNTSKGYGFVTFACEEAAKRACELFNQSTLQERVIGVELTDESKRRVRPPRAEKPERSVAGEEAPAARRPRTARPSTAAPAARKERGENGEPLGEPSETCLFVGNLPWKYREADVRNIFAAHQLKAEQGVRMIMRTVGEGVEISKGFCFVDTVSHAVQQAALSLNGTVCEGRELLVRVAVGGPHEKREIVA